MSVSAGNSENINVNYDDPIETEDKKLFRISPLAVIDHVQNKDDRELEKIYKENSIEFRIKNKVEYYDDDPTQKKWRFHYGVEFFVDGQRDGEVKTYVDYEPKDSTRKSAQSTISNDIFTTLEKRSLRNYAKKGFEDVAEILRGETK